MRDRRDRAENSVRLIDARAVVCLDALQVLLDQRDSCDLMRLDRLLDLRDRGLLNVKRRSGEQHSDGYWDHFCGV